MIKTDARIDVSSPNASKMSCISNTINNRSRGNDNRRGGWGRVIKMAVIIPFPIYRPNKIMRIDAVSEDIRPDPRIYILLKVTAADGGGHKSRIPPILRVYRPVCRRRCGTNDADAIRGHLVARMQEAKHAAKRDFVPSFPPLHPSTGLDNVQSRPPSAHRAVLPFSPTLGNDVVCTGPNTNLAKNIDLPLSCDKSAGKLRPRDLYFHTRERREEGNWGKGRGDIK